MPRQKPLILADDPLTNTSGQPIIQQLQNSNELDIPLNERFRLLNTMFVLLVSTLLNEGIELPPELIEYLEYYQKENNI